MKLKVLEPKNENGLIIYEGPSMLDGEKIVCVVTGFNSPSENAKTGDMLQSFIMRADNNPVDAIAYGDDESVCGSCVHRGSSCYVNVAFSVWGVWKAYKNNRYNYASPKSLALFKDRYLRIGSYGDGAMLPVEIWQTLIKEVKGWTGYSHQHTYCDDRFKHFLMASVETEEEAEDARSRGWRPFRVRMASDPLMKGEVECPASAEFEKERGFKLSCNECLMCNGGEYNAKSGKRTVTIIAHGSPPKLHLFAKTRKGNVSLPTEENAGVTV